MDVGGTNFPIAIGVLFGIMLLSVIFNIFLYTRGHHSYSIKYELMRERKIFRNNQFLCNAVEIIYKCFFGLPFVLLLIISILSGIVQPIKFLILMVNGLIVLLIIYPFKATFYYFKELILEILAIASQFITLFYGLYRNSDADSYTLLACVFYPLNCILFCLALLSQQDKFWDIQEAFRLCHQQLKLIYPALAESQEKQAHVQSNKRQTVVCFKNIPYVFNGGVYSKLCRYKRPYKYKLLYFFSLCVLAINAAVVWYTAQSSLGVVGLITNFIYDMFVFTFNVLDSEERSIRNVFILVFVGRFFSFAFGTQLWIIGYCILYFFVGIFIGKIIINNRMPLRSQNSSTNDSKHQINALRTPEFVIFILSAEIFFLVLAQSYNIGGSAAQIVYSSQISIPLWQFALIIVIATWIIIVIMASLRIYERAHQRSSAQYYFGSKLIKQYHVYVVIVYLLIIGLGLYCYRFLYNPAVFVACVFLPLIILVLAKMIKEWVKNQFQFLADTSQYNKKVDQMRKIFQKKQQALINQDSKAEEALVRFKIKKKQKEENKSAEDTDMVLNVKKWLDNDSQSGMSNSVSSQIINLEAEKLKWQELRDWRQSKCLYPAQFWKRLTPSDKWLISLLITLGILFTLFIGISYVYANSISGVFFGMVVVSALSQMPFYRYTRNNNDIETQQYIWYEGGWLICIVFWSIYNSQFIYCMLWAVIYIIFTTSLLAYGLLKSMKKQYIHWLLLNISLTIFFICIFLGFTVQPIAAIVVGIILAMAIVGAIPIAYVYIKGSLPFELKIVCGGIIVIGVIVISLLGFLLDLISDFAVFSFVMGVIYIILMIVASVIFYQKQANRFDVPHVYSAYGEPVYCFDSSTQKLQPSRSHCIIYDIASVVLVIYAATVTILFESKQYAVYVLGFYCCVSYFQKLLFSVKSYEELGPDKDKLTKELILGALNQLNNKYMADFRDMRFSKQVQRLKEIKKTQAEALTNQEELNEAWLQITKMNTQEINSRQEQEKFIYFWILLIQFHINAKKKNNMVQFIHELKSIEQQLIDEGIFIESQNYALDFTTKYEMVTKQIKNLNPFDYIKYQSILSAHQKKIAENNEKNKIIGQNIDKEHEKKEDEMFDKLKQDLNRPSSQKIAQFHKMTSNLKKGKFFVDEEFPANEDSLGSLASYVQKWRRPKTGQSLVVQKISPYDVKQGQIGDCYLISSLGVLGQKWIQAALGKGQDGKQLWTNRKGAYMVRFYKFLKEVYVIVDDMLPINNYDQFVFAKSEDEMEIWPCILEKAYAKLYSGYDKIVQGKCHRVFAELTGGFPFEILTQSYKNNINGLWQKLLNSKNNGYLLGAGSQAHADGDKAISSRGIVQGHAYSILDAKQIQQHKLIKLKNPHGSGGVQWCGDFADQSEYMTNRMMQLLDHKKTDDGIFWMKLEDFALQFKSLYICAVFDSNWLKIPVIEGEFTAQNSFGTPNLSNETFKSPQIGIKVTKKCTLFANMIQEAKNSLLGQNFIYMRIQRNGGKRISKQNVQSDKLCGVALRPTNAISLSNEVSLEVDEYPYVFTLYLSCKNAGDQGKYKLEMYCSDKEMEVIHDKDFDRSGF